MSYQRKHGGPGSERDFNPPWDHFVPWERVIAGIDRLAKDLGWKDRHAMKASVLKARYGNSVTLGLEAQVTAPEQDKHHAYRGEDGKFKRA